MPAKTHGHTAEGADSPTYRTWRGMIQRCTNPKAHEFSSYGGRGIHVCERWLDSFEAFLADMGERPEGTTLDRYPDNDGDYEPGNCRWATRAEQARNSSRARLVEINGETDTIMSWCRRYGINHQTVRYREQRGWDVELAITTPPRASKSARLPVQSSEATQPPS